ncbi:hypothetical protein PCIT_a2004 [Pseudoalteromonas citrea]|uniref:DUF945 domain-containing protein n=2 Tax=Pseudoalteromonas citrea TaxID=43655 RepID=A0AAD4AJ56_9GAMM|nr:hypothetical protein [Pseudoalteromonas citrea]KAF7772021.1 hypothetical protein PCIT_a2004 [Pseudoalteromonas citrea]
MKKSVIILLATGALAAGYVAMQSHVNQLVDDKLQAQFALSASESGMQFDYADASANVFNGNIVVNGLTVSDLEGAVAFSIDEIVLIGYEEDKISEFTEINMKGFTLSDAIKADNTNVPKALLDARYNFGTSLAYDAQTGYSRLKMDLAAQGISGLNFDMELNNSTPLMEVSFEMQKAQNTSALTVEEQLQMQTKVMDAMQQLAPKSLKVKIGDKGQLAQLLDEQVAAAGLDQASFENMLQMQLAQAPIPQAAKDAVIAFAQGKESFSLSVSLPENSDIESLSQQAMMLAGQPEELAKLLNLEVQGK